MLAQAASGVKTTQGQNGTCKWLDHDAAGLLKAGMAAPFMIRKNGEQPAFYWVSLAFRHGKVELVTVRKDAPNGDEGPAYFLTLGKQPACTCKGFQFGKGKACKHLRAVKAGLERLDLLNG